MHITIFGVGRSGTKAVQLYLSYLLARQEGKIWINYEPYFWLDRFTKNINYEGYFHHSHSPHIIRTESELSKNHTRFLKKLSNSKMSGTTKFIRGNGRMNAINQVIQPDHSIVIIRDIYQVLVSVLKTEWDFWSVGFQFTQSWESFINEIRKAKLLDNFDWCMDQINDRMDQNAFYWYAMNKAVLQSNWPDTFFVSYSNIKSIEALARKIIDPSIDLEINNEIFTGDYIHENYPLLSKSRRATIPDKINSILYHTKIMNRYNLFIPYKSYGSSAQLNMDYQKIASANEIGTKIRIEKKDLFEYFNEDISGMLKKIEWKEEDHHFIKNSGEVIIK